MTWQIDKAKGIAYVESNDFKPGRIELPLRADVGLHWYGSGGACVDSLVDAG